MPASIKVSIKLEPVCPPGVIGSMCCAKIGKEGDIEVIAVCHSHRSAQGCEIPGEDGQTPVEVDKVVGNAPGNAGQMDNQAAEQQAVGEGSEQEKGSADADIVGEGDSQAVIPGHAAEYELHHIEGGQRGKEEYTPSDPFCPPPDPGKLHIILFQNYNNSRYFMN